MKNPLIALTLAGAMAGSLMAVTPAVAAPDAEAISIQWRDLNLETVEGQRSLDRRIDNAAREVCGMNVTRTGNRLPPRGAKTCYKNAKASARQQVAVVREETRMGG